MAGEHHLVEALLARGAGDHHAGVVPAHAHHRAIEPNTLAEGLAQRLHIAARATLDHSPLWPLADREQAMVTKEADEEVQREVQHVGP
ncbi:hypothetical protein D3C76_1411880 [compost metagenome]